jgi:predicted SpoU family rRNA methylase
MDWERKIHLSFDGEKKNDFDKKVSQSIVHIMGLKQISNYVYMHAYHTIVTDTQPSNSYCF